MFRSRMAFLLPSAAFATCLVMAAPAFAAGSGPGGPGGLAVGLTIMATLFLLGGGVAAICRKRGVASAAFAITSFLAFASVALAQEVVTPPTAVVPSTVVSLGPLWATLQELIIGAIGTVLTAIIAFLAARAKQWFGVEIEARWRESLHSAAMTGVTAAMNRLQVKADAITLDVRYQIIADAVRWAQASVPDAVKGLGVDEASIQKLVESKLTQITGAQPTVVVGTATAGG